MDDHQPAVDDPHYHVWTEHGLVRHRRGFRGRRLRLTVNFIGHPRRYRTRHAARQGATLRSGLEPGSYMVRPCELPCRFHCGRET